MTPEQLRQKAVDAGIDRFKVARRIEFLTETECIKAAIDTAIDAANPTPEQPTLRDQFAMAALQGQLARQPAGGWLNLAEFCYIMADAMLAARKAEGSK